MKQIIVQSIGDSYPTGEETKALSFYNIARSRGREIRIVLHSVQQLVTYTTVNTKKICKAFGGNLAKSRLKWHILTRSSTQRVAHLLPVECAVVWM